MRSVRRLCRAALLVLCITATRETHAQMTPTGFLDRSVTVAHLTYPYQVYVPRTYSSAHRWPVILFLHGAGERGSDGLAPTAVGLAAAIRQHPERWPAIVVFPQAPLDSTWTGEPAEAALAALQQTMSEYATDPERVYLTGMSMGGHGAWYLAYREPELFAALAPVCAWVTELPQFAGAQPVVPAGDGDAFSALGERLAALPIWIFHGEVDPLVPVVESRSAAAALRAHGADVRYTELPGVGHGAWDPAYGSPALAAWLFAQRRK